MIESRPTLTKLYILEAQLLPQFTPSEQTTPPPHSYIVLPPWQPSSLLIFTSPEHFSPNSYTTFLPLAAQLVTHFTPSEQLPPHSLLHHFNPLAA